MIRNAIMGEAAIDKSYWHLRQQKAQRLYPDDRNNPIWNQDEYI